MSKRTASILCAMFAAPAVLAQECPIGTAPTQEPSVHENVAYDPTSQWAIPDTDVKLKSYSADTFDLIEFVNRGIERRGGRLAVIFPPKRSLFIPDAAYEKAQEIFSGTPKQDQLEEYAAIVEQLRETGALIPDLQSAFADIEQPYFKADHHWKPESAAATAFAIWDELADAGVLRLPLEDGAFEFGRQINDYKSGSYAEIINDDCGNLAHSEIYKYSRTFKRPSLNIAQEDALFGDAPTEDFNVTLLGTSFSAPTSNFQFDGALSYFLQAPVENVAIAGGSSEASFEILQTQPNLLVADLVVWEIAPNQFPIVSDKFRGVAATVLGGCSADAVSQTVQTQGDNWTDWIAADAASTLVDVDTGTHFHGQIRVEADFGNTVKSIIVEKSERTPKAYRTSVWQTFIGNIDANGDVKGADKVRIKIDDATQDHSVNLSLCAMEDA